EYRKPAGYVASAIANAHADAQLGDGPLSEGVPMPMPSAPLIALFLSVACLQSANGLFVVLLGLRMVDADFPTTVTGLIMSAYFLGS
ncbi:MAG: hypothetical protein VXY90_02475, partial [Pseudomonadota bacterium]|nr:hypothetical protein [Pseudomonadota bacterium]